MPSRRAPLALALFVSSLVSAHPAHTAPSPVPAVQALADLEVVGTRRLVRGAGATFEVRAFLAFDWYRRDVVEPPGTAFRARLVRKIPSRNDVEVRELTTTRQGSTLTFDVPDDIAVGDHTLHLEADTSVGPARAEVEVRVVDMARLLLRTDSEIVNPGGRLAWRAWLLNLHTRRPLPASELEVVLVDRSAVPRARVTVTTDRFGLASGLLGVPMLDPGRYELQVKVRARPELVATQALEVRPFEPQAFFVSLAEVSDPDKRLARYEVSARHPDGNPMARANVSVRSGRTRIAEGVTDPTGRFRFESAAPDLEADVSDTRGERVSVQHRREDAQPLDLSLITGGVEATPGEHVSCSVLAFRGSQPVATEVVIELRLDNEVVATQTVQTDGAGLAPVTFFVPPRVKPHTERHTSFEVLPASTTKADIDFARSIELSLKDFDPDCLERGRHAVDLLPEGKTWTTRARHTPFSERPDFTFALTPERVQCLDIPLRRFATRADPKVPRPVSVIVSISETITLGQERPKVEVVAHTPTASASPRELFSTPSEGSGSRPTVDSAVTSPGQVVTVHANVSGEALALLIDEGVAIASAPFVERQARLTVPASATGLLVIEVLELENNDPNSRRDRDMVQVFSRPRPLDVDLRIDAQARPGATLPLEVEVTDEGRPVVAALCASVLDERLLALSPAVAAQPSTLAWLAEQVMKPLDEVTRSRPFISLLMRPDITSAEQTLLSAILTGVPLPRAAAFALLPAPARLSKEVHLYNEVYPDVLEAAVFEPTLALGGPADTPPLATLLGTVLAADRLLDPWGRDRTWRDARTLNHSYEVEGFGREVTKRRAYIAVYKLRGRKTKTPVELGALVRVPAHLARDAWGRVFLVRPVGSDLVLVSAGPNGRFDNGDDLTFSRDALTSRRVIGSGSSSMGFFGSGAGGGGSGRDVANLRMGQVETSAPVRERFDTNVLWATAVTDTGRHTFEVPLSDAITTWRVDVEAMTADGRHGHARAQVVASLPLSVDLRLPDTLVLGDTFEARALIVNQSGSARDLALTANADGLTLGELDTAIRLSPGQSTDVVIPLFASRVGRATVTLSLTDRGDGRVVDSIIKHLDVQDIGARVRQSQRVRVVDQAALDTSVPADAREVRATLSALRGVPDLALSSLAGMLEMPTGCFEQTTARNWPNLLVLRFLPPDSELAAKAKELVHAGYERLKTFEVARRGFALYPGEAPETLLTAIGLVQLGDTSRVMAVEPAFVDRIARALMDRQRPDGHFRTDSGWYGSEEAAVVTAYASWALAETLRLDTSSPVLEKTTIAAIKRSLRRATGALRKPPRDPRHTAYVDVLAELAGARRSRPEALQERDKVPLEPATFFASGPSARAELAALNLLLALRSGKDGQLHVESLMGLRSARGSWGSTQATALALRALAELEPTASGGVLQMELAGQALPPLDLDGDELPTRVLETVAPLTLRAASPVTVELDVSWREATAPTRQSQGLDVHLEVPHQPLMLGDQTTLRVGVHNATVNDVTQPTVVLEIPPGFSLDTATSWVLVGAVVRHVEVVGRRVELYLHTLKADQAAIIPLTVTAVSVAHVTMRPVEAFAYYDPEIRGRSDQVRLSAIR